MGLDLIMNLLMHKQNNYLFLPSRGLRMFLQLPPPFQTDLIETCLKSIYKPLLRKLSNLTLSASK